MVDYLTHYYSSDLGPFQTLSSLPDEEALAIMEALYDDTPFGLRFKDPIQYLQDRQDTERWVRAEFIAKGGQPLASYPISMVLGFSPWVQSIAPNPALHAEIRIPLSILTVYDVSFTYPDSMISRWLSREKPEPYYQPELHGRVFTLPEILALVAVKGMPEIEWQSNLPDDEAPYIEAQVWNHQLLADYWAAHKAGK